MRHQLEQLTAALEEAHTREEAREALDTAVDRGLIRRPLIDLLTDFPQRSSAIGPYMGRCSRR